MLKWPEVLEIAQHGAETPALVLMYIDLACRHVLMLGIKDKLEWIRLLHLLFQFYNICGALHARLKFVIINVITVRDDLNGQKLYILFLGSLCVSLGFHLSFMQ